MRGVTGNFPTFAPGANVSIHTPHAGCDNIHLSASPWHYVSIHTPHAGCDGKCDRVHRAVPGFQSTHPMRGVTVKRVPEHPVVEFQSTHPMRGVTRIFSATCRHSLCFNPHTPCGV